MSGYTAALGRHWCATMGRPQSAVLCSNSAARLLRAVYSQQGSNNQFCRPLANTTAGTLAPSNTSRASSAAPSSKLSSVFDDSPNEHLPPLPVPNLGDTLELLRETIWPMAMNSAEFARAIQLIEQFAEGPGPKLDLLLRTKASQTRNWMTHDWWQQETYLKSRAPLVINSNPAMVLPELAHQVNNQRQLVQTSAQLISSLIEFKLALQSGYNPEASSEATEFRLNENLCYAQYKHIYGTTRVPGESIDHCVHAPHNHEQGFEFVLSLRGHFYAITLAPDTNEHEQLRVDTLVSLLTKIIDQNEQRLEPPAAGVGVLTTSSRDQWARTRPLLSARALQDIERAQFLVCLDTVAPGEHAFTRRLVESPRGSPEHLGALARQVLHADSANVANRWFDKSLQLVIVSDQAQQRLLGAGINYEHSLAEGGVVTKIIEFVHDKTQALHNRAHQQTSGAAVGASASSSASEFWELQMVDAPESEQVQTQLKRAIRDYAALVHQFDLSWFAYRHYGSNAIKSWRFSPDSWFQVALQLAHYQLHRRLGPAYESASTRRFALGRTETIRSLTKDVAEFCFTPNNATLQAAIESHKRYANAANNASAIDRVLLGYRLIFNQLRAGTWTWGVPTFSTRSGAAMVDDESFKANKVELEQMFSEHELEVMTAFFHNELLERTKKFALSTSQVSSIHPNICMSYGPYLANGYGCCYNLTGQQIVANVTANSENSSFSCQVHKFSESLHESLDRMRALVDEQLRQRRA